MDITLHILIYEEVTTLHNTRYICRVNNRLMFILSSLMILPLVILDTIFLNKMINLHYVLIRLNIQ